MSVVYVCNHCQKTIERRINVTADQNKGVFGVNSYHLCEDCFEEFKKFMNVKISETKGREKAFREKKWNTKNS